MNWGDFAKGCLFGAVFVALACLGAFLISLNPPVGVAVILLGVVVFFGYMGGKYGAPWA